MPSVRAARLRLLALWVAVAAHTAVVVAVATVALNKLQGGEFAEYRPDVLAPWLGLLAAPALLLSPLIGVLAQSRWPWAILVGSSAVGTAVGLTALEPHPPWLSVAAVLSLSAAFFGTTVLAILPAAGRAARLRPPTAYVVFAVALIVGIHAGFEIGGAVRFIGTTAAPLWASGVAVLATSAAALARFSMPEATSLSQGFVRPFLAGARDAVRNPTARVALVGLWIWAFVALTTVVALTRLGGDVPPADAPSADSSTDLWPVEWRPKAPAVENTCWFGCWLLVGILLAGLNRHHFRHAWLVPYAATVALVCLVWLRLGDGWETPLAGLGLALGTSLTGLLNAYHTAATPTHQGVAASLVLAGGCAGMVVLALILPSPEVDWAKARAPILNVLIGVGVVAVIGAWYGFRRPWLEGSVEPFLAVMYRTRTFGPDAERLPARGPCLVIANHAAWFDPLWLGQVLPAPTTPMMTSKFYDLPVVSWLMRHVIGTIRVPDAQYRREAPELQEAIAALDRGDCVVLFPEGYLRRKEEQPLRRFGRGVWQILADRPQTPIFACWIEGNWGSYFSFKGGPPTKNKRPDFRRLIRIGVVGPFIVDPQTLDDHMATRLFLMHQVNAARGPLGLEPLTLPDMAEGDKE